MYWLNFEGIYRESEWSNRSFSVFDSLELEEEYFPVVHIFPCSLDCPFVSLHCDILSWHQVDRQKAQAGQE